MRWPSLLVLSVALPLACSSKDDNPCGGGCGFYQTSPHGYEGERFASWDYVQEFQIALELSSGPRVESRRVDDASFFDDHLDVFVDGRDGTGVDADASSDADAGTDADADTHVDTGVDADASDADAGLASARTNTSRMRVASIRWVAPVSNAEGPSIGMTYDVIACATRPSRLRDDDQCLYPDGTTTAAEHFTVQGTYTPRGLYAPTPERNAAPSTYEVTRAYIVRVNQPRLELLASGLWEFLPEIDGTPNCY